MVEANSDEWLNHEVKKLSRYSSDTVHIGDISLANWEGLDEEENCDVLLYRLEQALTPLLVQISSAGCEPSLKSPKTKE